LILVLVYSYQEEGSMKKCESWRMGYRQVVTILSEFVAKNRLDTNLQGLYNRNERCVC